MFFKVCFLGDIFFYTKVDISCLQRRVWGQLWILDFLPSLSRLEEHFCLGPSCQSYIFSHRNKNRTMIKNYLLFGVKNWCLLFTVFRTIYGWSQNNWNLFMVWGQVLPPAPPLGNSERIRDCQNKFLFRDILCKGKHWETFKTFILLLGNIYFTIGKQLLAVK